ncbi:MAG: hypothetical protein QOC90_2448, partial [Mycobacterium sp.]|nr:hypothetical protein [Mycobacterium sp.]
GGPDDLDAVIRGFIDGAKQSVLVAVQELDSRPIAEAILAAARRPKSPPTATGTKLRVQVILEGSYLTEDTPLADPFVAGGDNEVNRELHAALLRAGVDVITDLNPEIFHQKFVVRDAGTDTAATLTGSANFTRTDTAPTLPTTRPSRATTSTMFSCCTAKRSLRSPRRVHATALRHVRGFARTSRASPPGAADRQRPG